MTRSRLCELELGYATPTPDEIQRIASAIEGITAERAKIADLVAEHGLSLAGVGLHG